MESTISFKLTRSDILLAMEIANSYAHYYRYVPSSHTCPIYQALRSLGYEEVQVHRNTAVVDGVAYRLSEMGCLSVQAFDDWVAEEFSSPILDYIGKEICLTLYEPI